MFIKKNNEFKKESKKMMIRSFWIIFILMFFISPAKAAVDFCPTCFTAPLSSFGSVTLLITEVINWFLKITAGVTIFFLIIGGIYYITAFGDDKRMEEGKRIITYSIYGLVIILISYSVVLTVNNIIFG